MATVRVGVDGMSLSRPLTGVGNYTARLVQRLAEEPGMSVTVGLYTTLGEEAPDLSHLRRKGVAIRPLPPLRSRIWSRASSYGVPLPYEAVLPGQDIYLFPNFRSQPSRRPTVSVIHDFTFARFPDLVPDGYRAILDRVVPRTVETSDLLLVPSPVIREEALSLYDADPSRTLVVPPLPPPSVASARGRPNRGKVLFLGTMEPRKNLPLVVRAVEIARSHGADLSLDIVGGGDPRTLGDSPESRGWLRVHGFLSNGDVSDLLDTTSALLMPSWYEGYGMPILEAMDRGTPVVVSDIPVFR